MLIAIYLIAILVGLWGYSLIYCRSFQRKYRFISWQIFFLLDSTVLAIPAYSELIKFNRISWLGLWLVIIFLLYFTVSHSYDISRSVAFFNAVWSVLTWQAMIELVLIIASFRGIIFENIVNGVIDIWGFGLIGIVVISIYLLTYFFSSVNVNEDLPKHLGPRQITLTAIIFSIFEIASMTVEWPFDISVNENWQVVYLSQVAGIIILFLECEMFKNSAMRKELETMQMLWGAHEEQYHLARVNIDLINQKCHDLKHQIRAIQSVTPEEREKYIAEIEESVDVYEHIVKTGNEVLDTILTEKSLYCRKHYITISCVADGMELKFINAVDLYAIFGNAIDNAIEAVRKFKDHDQRTIDVIVYRKDNFLVINIINPYLDEITFVSDKTIDGEMLPQTTKADKKHHGFGLKSIKYIVSKYDGFTSISTEDKCFSLKLLIPIPEQADNKNKE